MVRFAIFVELFHFFQHCTLGYQQICENNFECFMQEDFFLVSDLMQQLMHANNNFILIYMFCCNLHCSIIVPVIVIIDLVTLNVNCQCHFDTIT